jgi:hypothetical protein
MNMPDILNRAFVTRAYFDPTNAEHLESLKSFVRTGNWGSIQFHAELPYVEVPATVLMKYAQHTLGAKPETVIERGQRLAAKLSLIPHRPAPTNVERRAAGLARLAVANEVFDGMFNRDSAMFIS